MIFNFIKKNKALSGLIFFGLIAHLLISFPSGSYYCFSNNCGLYFWGAHEHDAIWHLAIIETAFKKIPPQHPTFAGENLTGYNYFLDFVIFLLSKTGVPSIIWYFKIIPLIWFFLYTFLSLKLAEKISKSYWFKFFLLFFNYFGTSFGLFFTLYHKKTILGSSSSLAMQPLLSLVNPQFAISLIFVLLILINFFEKNLNKKIFLYCLYLFINWGLKFYAGLVSLFLVLGLLLIENKTFKTKILHWLIIFLTSFFAVVIFYQPFKAVKTGSPLIFSPFSMVHSIIEEKDLFYLPQLVNARYYLYQFGFGPRLLLIEFFSVFLFIFFNFGVRFFGLVYFLINFLRKKINYFHLIIFLTILFSTFLTVFFIQKGMWWNTIQFTYYGLFLANIFTGLFLESLLKKKNIICLFLILFSLLINIPENIDILRGFNPFNPGSYISKKELEALNFLKVKKTGTILAMTDLKDNLHKESAYVAAFSGKQTYFNDLHILNITGVDYKKREMEIEKLLIIDWQKLPVKYFYLLKKDKNFPNFLKKTSNLSKNKIIFENDEVLIIEK